MTAFYMFRIYYLIFFWKKHEVHGEHAPKDQPWTMTVPLIVLALISCVAGFVPAGDLVSWNGKALETHMNWSVAGASVGIALIGIALATIMYRKENPLPDKLATMFKGL